MNILVKRKNWFQIKQRICSFDLESQVVTRDIRNFIRNN